MIQKIRLKIRFVDQVWSNAQRSTLCPTLRFEGFAVVVAVELSDHRLSPELS